MIKGLSCRFKISNGKFELTGGGQKAADNVFFILNFHSNVKVYYPDFNPGTMWVVQKAATNVLSFKPLILGKIKNAIEKYVTNVTVASSNLYVAKGDRKGLQVYINYDYTEPGKTINNYSVTFI